MTIRCRDVWGLVLLFIGLSASTGDAQRSVPSSPEPVVEALDPTLMKWYQRQELYYQYRWSWWRYSNYAREPYKRYVDVGLEGTRWYDLYGKYLTKGWKIYEWTQEVPTSFGSNIFKSSRYANWFNNVVIGHTSSGQYNLAVTLGDEIRTTLTPMTFSKPAFNGIQADFRSDKYALTFLSSRVNFPTRGQNVDVPETRMTDFNNLFGFRGTVQVGDFVNLGATYVNSHLSRTSTDLPLSGFQEGQLTSVQNQDVIRWIAIRITDDSPEDGGGGGVLFSEQIYINRGNEMEPAAIEPRIEGGLPVRGALAADGIEAITLTYVIPDPELKRKIGFEMVLANDYRVEATSNLQTNALGEPVFLPVVRADGNVDDGSNQRVVKFDYGLPTGNEIIGFTLEVHDLMGFTVWGEVDINNRWRRFPNINFERHAHASTRSEAFFLAARKVAYPWFGFGEVFSIDEGYSTSMFILDRTGEIDYSNAERNHYEFVDDNDDQDRWPDWQRANQPLEGEGLARGGPPAGGIFPGLDENNDFISDFNQNNNLRPDYDEPFWRYEVDPPEFLFGMDLDHNTIIDRFEDDDEPDYPYQRDHRGYNGYVGRRLTPESKVLIGYAKEWLWSDERESEDFYGLVTFDKDYAQLGRLQIFDNLRIVKDNLIDDQLIWTHPPGTFGGIRTFQDRLVAQDAVINTAFLRFDYKGLPNFNVTNKVKYEIYNQQDTNFARPLRTGGVLEELKDSYFLGIVNKCDYAFWIRDFKIHPKFRSLYRRRTAFIKGEVDVHNLTEMGILTVRTQPMPKLWLEVGTELAQFYDLEEELGSTGDFFGSVITSQISINNNYLGYEVIMNIGHQWERRKFENRDSPETITSAFIVVFAGLGSS